MPSTISKVQATVPEILAPAGGPEQFLAALYSGADAVYLGLNKFNARARATNFDVETLRAYLPLARKYNMKVLVTLNILVKDTELKELASTLCALEELEVDALIVQDLGVAALCRKYFPSLRLHASTQLAVHNLDGVHAAARLGFKRVVLARELTALEIKKIRGSVPPEEIEIEAFCHGSLCYSYSGLCFFSGAEDARSGNRGECAYTCRKPYKILSEPGSGFLFSMKDLNTLASLDKLVATGVHTLKIEGRKKDAQYVSTVVKAYRKRLDEVMGFSTLRKSAPAVSEKMRFENLSKPSTALDHDLSLSFRRDETSLFLNGRYHENVIDLENPGHRGLLIGRVMQVKEISKTAGVNVTFTSEKELQQFDGIRIEQASNPNGGPRSDYKNRDYNKNNEKYENQECHFSLRDIRSKNEKVFESAAGTTISIHVPQEHLKFEIVEGDLIFKTRSNRLKSETERISKTGEDDRLRALRLITLHIAASVQSKLQAPNSSEPSESSISREHEQQLILHAKIFKNDVLLFETSERFDFQLPRSGESNLEREIKETFSLFGDVSFQSTQVLATGQLEAFLPRQALKAFKRKIANLLPESYERHIELRQQEMMKCFEIKSSPTLLANPFSPSTQPELAIKIDRLEYLESLCDFVPSKQTHSTINFQTLVFEPKRAFLPGLEPAKVAQTLMNWTKAHGLQLRLALPTVMRQWDTPLLKIWVKEFLEAGTTHFEVGNIGGLVFLERQGVTPGPKVHISADFTLFALNRHASAALENLGISQVALSVEDDIKNMSSQLLNWSSRAEPEVILYKDTPLFIAESCSLTALHDGCPTSSVCGYRTLEIEDEKGARFFVAHESCKSVVYDALAYSVTHKTAKLASLGVQHYRVDFLTRPYTAQNIKSILNSVFETNSKPLHKTHSANFERELL